MITGDFDGFAGNTALQRGHSVVVSGSQGTLQHSDLFTNCFQGPASDPR